MTIKTDTAIAHSILDGLVTVEEIARRLTASSGTNITVRAIWPKAQLLGVARKIGRVRFVHQDDIHKLFQDTPLTALIRDKSRRNPLEARRRRKLIDELTKEARKKNAEDALVYLKKL